jgi:hypothetical protein
LEPFTYIAIGLVAFLLLRQSPASTSAQPPSSSTSGLASLLSKLAGGSASSSGGSKGSSGGSGGGSSAGNGGGSATGDGLDWNFAGPDPSGYDDYGDPITADNGVDYDAGDLGSTFDDSGYDAGDGD